jgi:dTDP-4-dehydrorhamnose 3,5-epimerase
LYPPGTQAEAESLVEIGERNGVALAVLRRESRSLGRLILDPRSGDLVEGVRIEPLRVLADDRGFFTELARLGTGMAADLMSADDDRIQISATLSYPGTIKAIHYHFEQTDLWAPVEGMFQVLLYDLRRDSGTFGRINTMYVGRYRPWSILIPPGVGHGYKVLGTDPALLIYITNRYYNAQDEGRLAWNDAAIAYDWETQHK